MAESYLVLECAAEGCVAEFYLNDIPVIIRGPEIGRFFCGPMDDHFVDGVNELAIVVNPGPTPGEALTGAERNRDWRNVDKERAWAKVSRYPVGATVGDGQGIEMMAVEWQAPSRRTTCVFPQICSTVVDLGPLYGRWRWQDSPVLGTGADVQAEIDALMQALHASLQRGEVDLFLALSRHRLTEGEKAYQLIPGEKQQMIRDVMAEETAQDWWGMEALDPSRYDLRCCAGDRMVELIAKDWLPILREKPDDEDGIGYYKCFLARIDGELQIVR
ncbi:hypothetical protein [Piscinibacter sakaiensis]|uniref:hypothetical protein n=1 Tax=Piscinibacter sakaiensis TaxID=1547922 RepID=UPI003AAC907F